MELDLGLNGREPLPEQAGAQAHRAMDQDSELARRASIGDTDAWDTLFDRFSPWAYRFAYAHLAGNHADAEDLCADVLTTVARSIGRYDVRKGTLDVWVHGIARHRLARFCRKRRSEAPPMADAGPGADAEEQLDPTQLEERACTKDIVNRALASLPERQAGVLVGKYVEGFSTDELARLASTTPRAIDSLLVRARAAFRTAFGALSDAAPKE